MDNNANNEIKMAILGAVPEREDEFLELWNHYDPTSRIVGDQCGFRLEAGPYGIIQFEHKSMAQIWLFSFIVQLFFKGILEEKDPSALDAVYSRNRQLLLKLAELDSCGDINEFEWSAEIPKPSYAYKRSSENPYEGMAFDLTLMAGAFFFLHEFAHVKFQNDEVERSSYDEELECDRFAVEFITSKVIKYSELEGYDFDQTSILRQKRGMAIVLGVAFILQMTPASSWLGTDSHPAVTDRIKNVLSILDFSEKEKHFWAYFYCTFSSVVTNVSLEVKHLQDQQDMKSLSYSLIDNIAAYIKTSKVQE